MSGGWTAGEPAIVYERCRSCAAVWYLPRGFCPRCGASAAEIVEARLHEAGAKQ